MSSNVIGRPMEILLVEDSLMSARLTMAALTKADFQYRLTWLKDGEEALAFVKRSGIYANARLPDLILLDLTLPKVDGRVVLAELKTDTRFKVIPIVVMTASTDPSDLLTTESHHVSGYLTKPVNITEFVKLITELKQFWHADMVLPKHS